MSTPHTPRISSSGKAVLQATLDELAKDLPGCHLAIASATSILFSGQAGDFDMLDRERRKASREDVLWFASTTKLLTAVCYLQLVDRGLITLDTDMRGLYAPFRDATLRILEGFDEAGKPVFSENDKAVTLAMMLNQTSGFGMEFGEKVVAWKKITDKGRGFVNSCKVDNLIHTPLCAEPGKVFEYGNSAEWLGLILPTLVDKSTEDYLQENVLRPLAMTATTFYPFEDKIDRLMPLRYGRDAAGQVVWEELRGQMDLLHLPRTREEIEYPVAGGGIYSRTSDYILLLQHLLAHYLSLGSAPTSRTILSDNSVRSLFEPTLPETAFESLLQMYNPYLSLAPEDQLKSGDADWSTAMAIYRPKDGRRRGGFGRLSGSVGWGGAAGTEYWIDPKSGLACVFTTQMLPGRCPLVANAKLAIEKAVYAALE